MRAGGAGAAAGILRDGDDDLGLLFIHCTRICEFAGCVDRDLDLCARENVRHRGKHFVPFLHLTDLRRVRIIGFHRFLQQPHSLHLPEFLQPGEVSERFAERLYFHGSQRLVQRAVFPVAGTR